MRPRPATQRVSALEATNTALGTSSVLLGLMLYAGLMYSSSYYAYFHISPFGIGFDVPELAVWSLRLVTLPLLTVLTLIAFLPRFWELLASIGVASGVVERLRLAGRMLAKGYLIIVAAGIVLMLLWRQIQPFGWTAPLLVALGLLLGQSAAALSVGNPRSRFWGRAVPYALAALFLMWVIALAAGHLGQQEAKKDAENIVRRVSVVVFSTERLSMTGPPGLDRPVDLGRDQHYRYRYSGLRLLAERHDRYYLLPVGFNRDTDPTYVIQDDENIRIELHPGVQRQQR